MIPDFPNFKKIELADRPAIETFTSKYPCYSDFNFTSFWAWDTSEERQISVLNDNLIARFTDYGTQEPFFSFLGTTNTERTLVQLIEYARTFGMSSLALVPEISIHNVDTSRFVITPDQDNFDYIYLTSRIAAMNGNQYKSKRRGYESFVEANPSARVDFTHLHISSIQKQVLSITRDWEQRKHLEHGVDKAEIREAELEEFAIGRLFEMAESQDLFVGILFVEDTPTAFTIEELLPHKYSLGHFWKSRGTHPYDYNFLARETARELVKRGIVYWNWEQNLGIESLRTSKSSYRPSDFLKKFKVLFSPQ